LNFACRCCGFLTISEHGNYEVCKVCFWEDDPIQAREVDYRGGANEMSLNEAKESFKLLGAVSKNYLQFVRQPLPEEYPPED
jgi:hypothetical protein